MVGKSNKTAAKHGTTIAYDICALVFCLCPLLTTIFGIDYHNANNIVQTAGKMFALSLFPLAIALIGIFNKKASNETSHIALATVFILEIIYLMILLIGFLDGGKLF